MLIKNCEIIYLDKIENGSVLIKDGKIAKINPHNEIDDVIVDGRGLYLAPGFIDVHIHGAGGYDTMDGTMEAINEIASAVLKHGVTAFTPTTMTVSVEEILKTLKTIAEAKKNGTDGALVLGAHLEGPFINGKAIGAQNGNYLLNPTIDNLKKITGDYENIVTSITLAPEVEGATELIKYICDKNIVCSMGHTKATYDECMKGVNNGISHITHLFNAMTPLNHREPGAVGAAFDSDITAEVIADGVHVSYPALRIAYKQKGPQKLLLITDAMMACCMKNGMYSLGGQKVIANGSEARLENGALAGSVLTLDKAVRNLYKNTKIPLNELVRMASYNPAKHCKVENHKGLIKEGYDADFILFDEEINIKKVFINGVEKYTNN